MPLTLLVLVMGALHERQGQAARILLCYLNSRYYLKRNDVWR